MLLAPSLPWAFFSKPWLESRSPMVHLNLIKQVRISNASSNFLTSKIKSNPSSRIKYSKSKKINTDLDLDLDVDLDGFRPRSNGGRRGEEERGWRKWWRWRTRVVAGGGSKPQGVAGGSLGCSRPKRERGEESKRERSVRMRGWERKQMERGLKDTLSKVMWNYHLVLWSKGYNNQFKGLYGNIIDPWSIGPLVHSINIESIKYLLSLTKSKTSHAS